MVKISIRLIALGLTLAGLAVYAVEKHPGERWAHYTFEFDERGEDTGIKVLDWKLGDAPLSFMHAPISGPVPQTDNATGKMPVADFLYFKWRVLSTGRIYEDKLDLRSRLPSDMNDKTLHFAVEGSQLIVYLIFNKEGNKPGSPDCPVHLYFHNKCTRIYPDHWSNF